MQSHGSWQKANIAPARFTALGPTAAAISSNSTATFAKDSEGDIPAPSGVLRPAPFQDNRSLIDGRDYVPGS